jgi:phage tail-like protein
MTSGPAAQNNPTPNKIHHPPNYITANRFYVEIHGEIQASFTEFSGVNVQIDKEVYFEGGVNEQQRIFLKHTKFNDVTLKRGMTDDMTFWNWLDQVLSLREGGDRKTSDLRRNITIMTFNQAGQTMQSWTLVGAVPVGWKTPGFQASATTVAIEELTLAYEGVRVKKGADGKATQTMRKEGMYFDGSA